MDSVVLVDWYLPGCEGEGARRNALILRDYSKVLFFTLPPPTPYCRGSSG